MSHKKRRSRRSTPHARRSQGQHARGRRRAADSGPPDLLTGIRQALSDRHPLALLELASGVLTVTDPRSRDPFHGDEPERLSQPELIDSLLEVPIPETSAILGALALLLDDEVARARIRRELAGRAGTLPRWLDSPSVRITGVNEMVHVLRDGDNILLGVELARQHELTAVVYIDHNVGTLVKDAFMLDEPLDVVTAQMHRLADDPDMTMVALAPADARARITDAIAKAAITYPRFETDSWPMCRALVEWIVRELPAGGSGYEVREWSKKELDEIARRFLGSSFAAALDETGMSDLLDAVLWFGSGYGGGDPLRWSPVSVEIFLVDWVPRKIVAPARELAPMPGVLRAFIRFAHDERGIRPTLTDETLAAVTEYAPEYLRIIATPHPQGPAAMLAAMGFDPDATLEVMDWESRLLDGLAEAVGGVEQLDRLSIEPLPDEAFDWSGIEQDIRGEVDAVLTASDAAALSLFDVEIRTAARRLLRQVALAEPAIFRRGSGRPDPRAPWAGSSPRRTTPTGTA